MATTTISPFINPQQSVQLAVQSTDPAANAAQAQVYAKANAAFFQDTSGNISNIIAQAQSVANALGTNTFAWPYGCYNASGPCYINSGASANYLKGIVAMQAGSIVGAFCLGNAASAYSGNLVVYKNTSSYFTALTNIVMQTSQGIGVPKYATFPNGLYPVAAGDAIDCYVTHNGSGLYMGAGLIFNFGNTSASALSTTLSANTTVAPTDNQRVWQASSSTQYVLTLPASQTAQDFYVRAVVTGSGGIKIQAPSGVTIYRGGNSSSAGGTLTVTQLGVYVVLYNPAGSNVWIVTDSAAPSTLA